MEPHVDEQAQREAPQRRILQGVLARLNAMDRKLDSPGQQGPAGRRPMSLCATWGPIGQQTPRRSGTAGFEGLAPLVSPGVYLTPNYPTTVNPFVSVPGPFYWCSSHVSAEFCWTYTYQPMIINTDVTASTLSAELAADATTATVVDATAYPASGYVLIGSEIIQYTGGGGGGTSLTGLVRGKNGSTAAVHASGTTVYSLTNLTAPVAGKAQGGLFDPAIANNGGAIILNNFAGTQQFTGAPVHPRICCEIDIYDKTRGRSLTSGRVPIETFMGGNYGFKKLPHEMAFERGTQIEPRLYVTECRMMSIMDETAVYLAADVKVYVSFVFKGYTVVPHSPPYIATGGPA